MLKRVAIGGEQRISRSFRGLAIALAAAAVAAFGVPPVANASMTVTATGDGGGSCTLREAIEAVNAHNGGTACGPLDSGMTTIHLPANTYTPTNGQLVVEGSLAIVGANENAPSQTVIEAGASRAMEVKVGGSAKLIGVEITGGRTADAPAAPDVFTSSPVGNGGGILNHGSLVLEHALVTENQTGKGSLGANAPLQHLGGGGGAGGSGGGIYNDAGASLTVKQSTISKNFTGDGGNGGEGAEGEVPEIGHNPGGTGGGNGGPAGDGGGIYNAGSVLIEGSTISGNFTGRGGNGGNGGRGGGETTFGAGIGGDGGDGGNSGKQYRKDQGTYWDYERGGGGIANAGSLTIVNSTISGNATGAGGNGGVSGYGGEKKDGTFRTSGRAGTGGGGGRGGGLLSTLAPGAPVHLTNVTIFGNLTGDGGTGGGGGGGADSTLGGGTGGWGGDGGGIWAHGAKSGSEMTLMHVTIAGNGLGAAGPGGGSPKPASAGSPGGRGLGAGIDTGGRYDPGGAGVYEKNSIIAGNGNPTFGDGNCYQRYLPTYTDLVDQGGNVTWNDTTCPGLVADPKLGPLADNGGLTKTSMPGPGGSAIGAVPSVSCLLHEDQRGQPRPGAGKSACDAGAVETQSGEPPPSKEEEKGGEQQGGGNSSVGSTPGGGGSGGGSAAAGNSSNPGTKQLKCRKGFKKKIVKGKPKCVRIKKPHSHRH